MTRDDRLRLAFVGMHPTRAGELVAQHGSPAAVLAAIASGRVRVPDRARAEAAVPASRQRERLDALGVAALFHGDAGYPAHLAELPDAPDVLFCRGRLPERPMVAIVGTRRCTRYGRALAGGYGRAVSAAGWAVVSGLARGIDGAAHQGVVAVGGVGVAVLGSGPDVLYPREHRPLADDLLGAGGAVITEYPPGTPPPVSCWWALFAIHRICSPLWNTG